MGKFIIENKKNKNTDSYLLIFANRNTETNKSGTRGKVVEGHRSVVGKENRNAKVSSLFFLFFTALSFDLYKCFTWEEGGKMAVE